MRRATACAALALAACAAAQARLADLRERPSELEPAAALALADEAWHRWSTAETARAGDLDRLGELAELDRAFDRLYAQAASAAAEPEGAWPAARDALLAFLRERGAL